jgi:CHAD domain-containing protein
MAEPVSRTLIESLEDRWKRFRKELKALRRDLTVDAVHDERTACRRLLSVLGVLEPLVGRKRVRAPRRELKRVLRALGPLRDVHIELERAKRLRGDPRIPRFREYLRGQGRELEKKAARRADRVRPAKLRASLRRIEKRLEGARSSPRLLDAIDTDFSMLLDERRSLDLTDVKTVHRLRVAVKKFRYDVEALRPLLRGFERRRLEQLHRLQDLLGDLHDLEVMSASYRDFTRKEGRKGVPQVLPLQKYLLERHHEELRKAVGTADRIFEFWQRWARRGAARLRRDPA